MINTPKAGSTRRLTVFLLDEMEKVRGEIVSELGESCVQLLSVDGSRAIAVEMTEDVLPVLDVFPEAGELHATGV